jgi:hypothetical protein
MSERPGTNARPDDSSVKPAERPSPQRPETRPRFDLAPMVCLAAGLSIIAAWGAWVLWDFL